MTHKNIYDLGGDQYDFTRSADPYLTAKIFDLLHPHSSGMHLDIGCGTGNYTMALAAKGLNFTGIDPSEKMLDVARAFFRRRRRHATPIRSKIPTTPR